MGLKKNYSTGTKYQYANIESMQLLKENTKSATILIMEKDSLDLDHFAYITRMPIEIPCLYTTNLETGELEYNPANDPFSVESMSAIDNNPYKITYVWMKDNMEMFKDWIDVLEV